MQDKSGFGRLTTRSTTWGQEGGGCAAIPTKEGPSTPQTLGHLDHRLARCLHLPARGSGTLGRGKVVFPSLTQGAGGVKIFLLVLSFHFLFMSMVDNVGSTGRRGAEDRALGRVRWTPQSIRGRGVPSRMLEMSLGGSPRGRRKSSEVQIWTLSFRGRFSRWCSSPCKSFQWPEATDVRTWPLKGPGRGLLHSLSYSQHLAQCLP